MRSGSAVPAADPAAAEASVDDARQPSFFSEAARRGAGRGALLLGVFLVALNLRTSFVGVGPVIKSMQGDTGLPLTALGLLVTLPLVGIGLGSPVAPRLALRYGIERTVFGSLLVLALAVVLRSVPESVIPGLPRFTFLYTGTLLLGMAIAVGSVLVPALIRRSFSDRPGSVTSMFVATFAASGAVAAVAAVPLQQALGWRMALGLWALPALAAAFVWGRLAARPTARASTASDGAKDSERNARAPSHPLSARSEPTVPRAHGQVNVWRSGLAWAVTAFMCLQSFSFYVLVAWVPTLLQDSGQTAARAGFITFVFQLACLAGSMSLPMIASRSRDLRPAAVTISLLIVMGFAAVLWQPNWPLSVIIAGIGCGGSLGVAMVLLSARSSNSEDTGALSGMAQSVGYLVSAVGPIFIGYVHEVAGGWTPAFALAGAIAFAQVAIAMVVGRPGVMRANRLPA